MWKRAVPRDCRDVTLFLKQMRKQYDSCAKILVPKIRHCPASPKGSARHTGGAAEGNPTHKPEDLWSAAEAIPERKALIQKLFTRRKSLLQSRRRIFKNLHACTLVCSFHHGERGLHLPPATQFIRTFKLSFSISASNYLSCRKQGHLQNINSLYEYVFLLLETLSLPRGTTGNR